MKRRTCSFMKEASSNASAAYGQPDLLPTIWSASSGALSRR
ncbi:hypothetical protein LINPERPRIM_LOCUS34450, partial [Linum perenne]